MGKIETWLRGTLMSHKRIPAKSGSELVTLNLQPKSGGIDECTLFDDGNMKLPQFEDGEEYDYQTEDYKEYHNIRAKFAGKNKVGYQIKPAMGAAPIESEPIAPRQPARTQAAPQQPSNNMSKADWEARDKRIERGGYAHDAANLLGAAIMQGKLLNEQTFEELATAHDALTNKLIEKAVLSLQMGSLKMPKEEKKD